MGSNAMLGRMVLYFLPMVLSLTVHECAHALSAHWLGDDTAKDAGRLTLNPWPHIDPFGTLLLPALSIAATGTAFYGWAKPTPINPARFRRDIRMGTGIALSAAAGPISNVLLGALAAALYGALSHFGDLPEPLRQLLIAMMGVNAGLAVFNLLPVPPLDGSRVVFGFLPPKAAQTYARLGALSPILLIAVITLPALSAFIFTPAHELMRLFEALAAAI